MSIEEFLGLTEEEIKRRKDELRRTIPTIPGISYIETKKKIFNIEPWEFIIYLAHYQPSMLSDMLNRYVCYNGAESGQFIMEQLREYLITVKVWGDMKKEQKLERRTKE